MRNSDPIIGASAWGWSLFFFELRSKSVPQKTVYAQPSVELSTTKTGPDGRPNKALWLVSQSDQDKALRATGTLS